MKLIYFTQYSVIDGTPKTILTPDDGSVLSNPYIYLTTFELKNISIPFANTIRRALSTLCPTVTFIDGLDTNSIKVVKNSGALHNEFLTHRLSLIPINIDNPLAKKHLKITTSYDPKVGKRDWNFADSDLVPIFDINIHDHESLVPNIHMNDIVDVTTDNINVLLDSEEISNAAQKLFLKDPFTNDPILITSLKTKLEKSGDLETIHIQCHPVPNVGKYHTRNDPTGTVEYSFKLEDEDRIKEVWQHKLQFLKKERIDNGLQPYKAAEIDTMERNFQLLDKERVYRTDDKQNANHFNFTVESIGCMSSNQIIYNSIQTLSLYLQDIAESVSFKKIKTSKSKSEYKLDKSFSPKVSIHDLNINNVNRGCIIKIDDENHTLGGLLQYKLREKFLVDGDDITKYLKIANYKMNHPTIDEIDFVLCIRDDLSNELMDKLINKYIKELEGEEAIINTNNTNRINYFCLILFLQIVNQSVEEVDNLLSLFSEKTNIKKPLYEF